MQTSNKTSGAKRVMQNRLSHDEYYELRKMFEEAKTEVDFSAMRPSEACRLAQSKVGFTVSVGTVKSIAKTIGITFKRKQTTPKSVANSTEVISLEKKVTVLETQMNYLLKELNVSVEMSA